MNRSLECGAKRSYHVDRHQVRHFRRPRRPTRWLKSLWIMALVASGVLITVYLGTETIPYTERKHLVLMSRVIERDLGELLFKLAKVKFKDKILPPDHPYSIRVHSISQNIIESSRRGSRNEHNRLNWEVLVVDSPDFKASCVIGGKIVVYAGVLDHLDSDEAVASVVAHEVGHAVARHHSETFTKEIELHLMVLIISLCIEVIYCSYIRRKHGLYTLSTCCFVYVMLILLVSLPSSRRRELEADYIGMQLMASAGYDPRAAIRVLEWLVDISRDYPHNDIFSKHPSHKKRAQALARTAVVEGAFIRYIEARVSNGKSRSRDSHHLRRSRKE